MKLLCRLLGPLMFNQVRILVEIGGHEHLLILIHRHAILRDDQINPFDVLREGGGDDCRAETIKSTEYRRETVGRIWSQDCPSDMVILELSVPKIERMINDGYLDARVHVVVLIIELGMKPQETGHIMIIARHNARKMEAHCAIPDVLRHPIIGMSLEFHYGPARVPLQSI